MTGVMFLRRPSLLTRVAAVVIGCVWAALGAWWTFEVVVHGAEFPTRRSSYFCFGLLGAGIMLIGSGLRPWRARDFDGEVSDLGKHAMRGHDDF
jgi:hypothetical protein